MALGDTFYFVIHPGADRSAVQVMDLACCVDYERTDWLAVNDQNFYDRAEAIAHAKALAVKYGLQYIPFSSRYDNTLNERPSLDLNMD